MTALRRPVQDWTLSPWVVQFKPWEMSLRGVNTVSCAFFYQLKYEETFAMKYMSVVVRKSKFDVGISPCIRPFDVRMKQPPWKNGC